MIVLSAFPTTLEAGQDQLLTKMANDKPVAIPVLGRPGFSLGCLYDLSTHTVYVRKLWNEEELEDEKLTIADQTYSNQYGKITNGQEKERFLRMSFLSMLFLRFFSYGDLKPNCGLLVFIVVCSLKSISKSIRFFKARVMSKIDFEDDDCKSWSRASGRLILS